MVRSFICETCKNEYSRPTYTATATRQTKEYWREREGTEFGTCSECYKKEQEEKRQKAISEAGLPELTGSEKQIGWATKIRFDKYEISKDYTSKMSPKGAEVYDRLFGTVEAKFWIDNRDKSFRELATLVMSMAPAEVEAEIKAEEEKESKAKMQVLLPATPVDETPVEIKVADVAVIVNSKKDEKIIEVCKNSGYSWKDGAWRKAISFRTGTAIDRAADIGNKLLNAGYPVAIDNADAAQKAVSAEFEPECTRWVSVPKGETGRFMIYWRGKNQSLYETARSLPHSSYDSPDIMVPIKYFREVEDFAGLYGFKFSPGAIKAIAEYKASLEVKRVVPGKAPKVEWSDGLKKILESSNDIIEDLKESNHEKAK
ncbi:MAG: hypothetical protein WC365_00555 [Candidatus Babeliales bacterium]|jgi:Tfp pilus assembly major pilin PilA